MALVDLSLDRRQWGKVWSRQKGVKRSNRQKAEETRNEKEGIRTRQGFGELKNECLNKTT